MKTGNKPQSPSCPLGRLIPSHPDTLKLKRDGWNDHRILVVHADDEKLTWMERQVVEIIGKRLFGRKAA